MRGAVRFRFFESSGEVAKRKKGKSDAVKHRRKVPRFAGPTADEFKIAIDSLQAAGFDTTTREQLESLRGWRYRSGRYGTLAESIDAIVLEQKPDAVLAAVLGNLDLADIPLRVEKRARGVVLLRRDSEVATILATRASFPSNQPNRHPQVVEGDYLRPGPQWGELRRRLIMRYPSLYGAHTIDAEAAGSAGAIRTSFPNALPAARRAAALEASRRIREKRSHDYGDHVVHLTGQGFDLRFRPIRTVAGAVEVPFTLARDGAPTVDAALRLRTPTDPLAIAFDESTPERAVAEAWILALHGFADLTCVELPELAPTRRARVRRGSRARPGDPATPGCMAD